MKKLFRLLILFLAVALFLAGWMLLNARATPIVRRAEIALPFPADAPRKPVTIALLTDTHLSGPDNSPQRLARIVDQVNALKADLILLGGDYIGDDKGVGTYNGWTAIASFARLRAPLGVVAVLGNHDHRSKINRVALSEEDWRRGFARMGITLLQDHAIRRGPLAIGGLRDFYTEKPSVPQTFADMRRVGGAQVLLSHGPDLFYWIRAKPLLMLVGHTHCGQIAFPIVGPLYIPSNLKKRYACGLYRENGMTMIVAAGVGTSKLPFRMLAPPDIWLITVRPQ